jgi:hypothetical protein
MRQLEFVRLRRLRGALLGCLLLSWMCATPVSALEPAEGSKVGLHPVADVTAVGSRPQVLSAGEVRASAAKFLQGLSPTGGFSDWRNAQMDVGSLLTDKSGQPAAWVFRVTADGQYVGYFTVNARASRSPVLEFSRNPAPVFETTASAQRSICARIPSAKVGRQVFFGPADYRVELVRRDAPAEYVPIGALASEASTAAVSRMSVAPASLGTSYHLIAGVQDFDQFTYDYTSGEYNANSVPKLSDGYEGSPQQDVGAYYSGCTPTAASDIVWYWYARRNLPNLVRGALPFYNPVYDPDDAHPNSPTRAVRHKVVNDMHVAMGTFAWGDAGDSTRPGATYSAEAGPGMVSYALQVGGYVFDSATVSGFSWDSYVTEIGSDRPTLLLFQDLSVENDVNGRWFDYGNHAITGVGYDYTVEDPSSRYMIIYDNWLTTPAAVYIEYDGWNDWWSSNKMVTFRYVPPPTNNAFASAQSLSGTAGTVSGTNAGATLEANEPRIVDNSLGGSSVWYRWTAPFTGKAAIDTFGSSFDTVLGVYTGSSLGALTPVADNDDCEVDAPSSRVVFDARAGTTYRIAVDGYRTEGDVLAASGDIRIDWGRAVELSASAPSTCRYGFATVSGSVLTAEGVPVAGRAVDLQVRGDSDWLSVNRASSSAGGGLAATAYPTSTQSYRWRFGGDGTFAPMVSTYVNVTPAALVGTPSASKSVKRNKSLTVKGTLSPRHAAGSQAVLIHCYRYERKKWRLKSRFWAVGYGNGYRGTTRLKLKGSWRLRALHPADDGNTAVWSGIRSVRVK